jgi:hypothetical protein
LDHPAGNLTSVGDQDFVDGLKGDLSGITESCGGLTQMPAHQNYEPRNKQTLYVR